MSGVTPRAFDIVPEYGPTLVWHDLWTDELAGGERRERFWDAYMGVNRRGEWVDATR